MLVKRAIEHTEKVISAAKELKKSLMQYLFTYGPVPIDQADQVPLKETEIGMIPEHWEVVRLVNIATVKTSTSQLKSVNDLPNGTMGKTLLFLKVSDLNNPSNRRNVSVAATMLCLEESIVDKLKVVPRGSIIFPKRGAAIATNKKRMTSYDCLLDPNLAGVIPGEGVLNDFLFACLEHKDLRNYTDKNTLPQINKKDIEQMKIPLPPMSEQRLITDILGVIDYKMETEERGIVAAEGFFDSMLSYLMTGKLRVKDLELPEEIEVV